MKIELSECLQRDRVVVSDISKAVVVRLLCCVVMLEQDAEHLHVQSSWIQGRAV